MSDNVVVKDGYTVIEPNGTVTSTELKEELPLSLAQELVGGFVELVPMPDDTLQIMVDEDGLIKGLAFNGKASNIAGRPLMGTALIVTGKARWS